MHAETTPVPTSTEAHKLLLDELSDAISSATQWYAQCDTADRVRHCRWNGQSDDGKKHANALGRPPFPWEGASDCLIRIADEIINDEVRLLLAALRRATFQAIGVGAEDAPTAQIVSQLLRWQMQSQMRTQMRREIELAAQWRQTYGASVSCISWGQEIRRIETEIDASDAAAIIAAPLIAILGESVTEADAAAVLQAAPAKLADPLQEDTILPAFRTAYPLATRSEIRATLAKLRHGEPASLYSAEVYGSGPRIAAHRIFTDIFFPPSTWDIQTARWVAHRELLTETELRSRIETEDYSPEWSEAAIQQKGTYLTTTAHHRTTRYDIPWENAIDADPDLIEIHHFYYRHTDDNLVTIRHTVLHHAIPDLTGWDGELPYAHGQYPFVVHRREHFSRPIIESRGIPEIAETWQNEIKAQRDSRVDRTSLSTLPPILVPPSRGVMRLPFGPGVQWPKRKGEEIEWMRPPPYDASSIEIERATERTIDRYFGRQSEGTPPDRTLVYQQHLVDGWLVEMESIAAMILQLDQQYLPDEISIRVTRQPIRLERAEIQGQYDLQMFFDARNLNSELLKEKLALINTLILPLDRAGSIDLSKMVQLALSSVDPTIAELVLTDLSEATRKQETDELDILTKMIAGIETPPQPSPGTNYALRAQVLQTAVAINPEMQQMIAARPVLAQMVEARTKFLAFQQQQGQNAITGRTGVTPVLPPPVLPTPA